MIQMTYDLANIDVTKYSQVKDIYQGFNEIISLTEKKSYSEVDQKIEDVKVVCANLKKEACALSDEEVANISFILDQYTKLLGSISAFWQLCDALDYKKAWNSLQDGLDSVQLLRKFVSGDGVLPISIAKLGEYLENIERIYPYEDLMKNFGGMSIGAQTKKEICSICQKSPYDPYCSHIAGHLYMGERALVIKELDLEEISLVDNPQDKRCVIDVPFDKKDIDNSLFRGIHTLITKLGEPYRFFDLKVRRITRPLRTTEG